jgi:hypothetical protein
LLALRGFSALSLFFLIAILFPKFVTKLCSVLVSEVSPHIFPLSILSGSDAAVIASHTTFLIVALLDVPNKPTIQSSGAVPHLTHLNPQSILNIQPTQEPLKKADRNQPQCH